jgi:hypothetical protein
MPTYTMLNTEVTDSRHWIQFGECLLLFAALLGIGIRTTHDANAAFGTSVLCTLSGAHSALSAQ